VGAGGSGGTDHVPRPRPAARHAGSGAGRPPPQAAAALAATALPLGRPARALGDGRGLHARRLRRLCEAARPRHHRGRPGPLLGRRPDAGDHRRRHRARHRNGVAGVRTARPDPTAAASRSAPPRLCQPAAWSQT
jgi:hypothetical protein